MTEAREAELIRAAQTLRCAGEIEGFRAHLAEQGERPTGLVAAAILEAEMRVAPRKTQRG